MNNEEIMRKIQNFYKQHDTIGCAGLIAMNGEQKMDIEQPIKCKLYPFSNPSRLEMEISIKYTQYNPILWRTTNFEKKLKTGILCICYYPLVNVDDVIIIRLDEFDQVSIGTKSEQSPQLLGSDNDRVILTFMREENQTEEMHAFESKLVTKVSKEIKSDDSNRMINLLKCKLDDYLNKPIGCEVITAIGERLPLQGCPTYEFNPCVPDKIRMHIIFHPDHLSFTTNNFHSIYTIFESMYIRFFTNNTMNNHQPLVFLGTFHIYDIDIVSVHEIKRGDDLGMIDLLLECKNDRITFCDEEEKYSNNPKSRDESNCEAKSEKIPEKKNDSNVKIILNDGTEIPLHHKPTYNYHYDDDNHETISIWFSVFDMNVGELKDLLSKDNLSRITICHSSGDIASVRNYVNCKLTCICESTCKCNEHTTLEFSITGKSTTV